MNPAITRRGFLRTGGAAVVLAATTPRSFAVEEIPPPAKRVFKKAIMWGTVGIKGSVLDKMKVVKAAGFDGVEMTSHLDQVEVLRARAETGLEITSVCGERHWKQTLSHPDAQVRAEGLAALQQTLRDAKAYGAGSVLLVPGVVNNEVNFDDCWQRSIEQIQIGRAHV
jgi:L-ribulose-5-phosphate 3-epimerase